MAHENVKVFIKIWFCLLIGLAVLASAQEAPEEQPSEEGALSVNYFGELGWTVKYGLGDSRELSRHGYATQVLFEQYIALTLDAGVQVDWPISGVLRVSAQLDNRKANNLQSFRLGYKAQTIEAAFEDFSMRAGSSDFVATDRLLKGLRFSWDISEIMKLSGKFARVEGISQVRTFRGNTSRQTVEFSLHDPEQPWLEAPYQRNLKGLEHFYLRSYVPGFTIVSLRFELTSELRTLLTNYGLDYLLETVEDDPEPELDATLYDIVIENGSNVLVLKRPTLELLRDQIRTYIDDYNDEHNLFDENAKEYPFGEGTDYEQGFLQSLRKHIKLATPDEALLLESAQRGRFFYLGYENVKEETLALEIKRQGSYVPLPDPDLSQFQFTLFPEQGIITLDFPEEFFTNPRSAVRIIFDYTVPGGFYVLGLAVLQNSERVYIKHEGEQEYKLLRRDRDYQIDYETGALLLLPPYDILGDKDELKIEYELLRGGLGGFAEHQRVFTGLSYQWTPWSFLKLSLDALRAFDTPPPDEGRERLRTMPNTHSVLGLGAQLDLGDLKADLKLGYTENIFPAVPFRGTRGEYHSNERVHQRNRVNAIMGFVFEGRRVTLFGHQNGLLVYDGSRWQSFTTAQGLSGRGVRGIAVQRNTVLLAADSGLSLVKLEPGYSVMESLAKPINWKRFYKLDGLPHNEINDVFIDRSGTVWVGTKGGLARVPLAQITERAAWKTLKRETISALRSDLITKITSDGTRLYLGTDKGLALYEPETGQSYEIAELRGQAVRDLVSAGSTVYVATDRGIYELADGLEVGWRVEEIKVQALAVQNLELWYGTEIGLFRLSSDAPLIQEYSITAIEKNARAEELWVGPQAADTFEMPLWQVSSSAVKVRSQAETRLNGRDEARFADISPEKNTDHGWLAQLSAQYKLGSLELKALLEGITPEFLAIGQESRQEAQRFTVSAAWPVSPTLSLSGEHVMSVAGGWRTFVMADRVRASWRPWADGTQLTSALALELTDRDLQDRSVGFDITKITLNLKGDHKIASVGFLPLVQEITLGGTYDGLLTLVRLGRSLLDSKAGLTLGVAMTPSVKLRGSLTLGDRWTFGDQRLPGDSELGYTLGADWQHTLGFGQLTTSYTQATRLRAGRGSFDENASLTMRFSDFTLVGVKLSPTLTLSGRRTTSIGGTTPSGTLTLTLEGRVSSQWQTLSGSLFTRHTLSSDLRSSRDSLKNEFTGSLAWALSPQLQTRFELGLTLDTLTHPALGSKQTVRPRARLSIDWTPQSSWKTGADLFWQMTLSERERVNTFELGGRASWGPLSELSLSVDARASLDIRRRDQKPITAATWGVTLQGDYELGMACAPALDSSDCALSASLGYSGRLDRSIAVPFGQGIFAQVRLNLNF